jgi:hypothetical protein
MTSYEPRYSGSPVGPLQEHAVAIAGPEFAARIVAQRGAFTVFGTAAEAALPLEDQNEQLAGAGGTVLSKVVLAGAEADWKRSLELVGIGPFSAFPDLDGLAGELRTRYFK